MGGRKGFPSRGTGRRWPRASPPGIFRKQLQAPGTVRPPLAREALGTWQHGVKFPRGRHSLGGPQLCPLNSPFCQLESSLGRQQDSGNSKLGWGTLYDFPVPAPAWFNNCVESIDPGEACFGQQTLLYSQKAPSSLASLAPGQNMAGSQQHLRRPHCSCTV